MIDALVAETGFSDVRLIKMDLEGEDFAALAGARETLQRWRPMLVVEHHRGLWAAAGQTLASATDFLIGELDYHISPLIDGDVAQTLLALP